MHFAADYAEDVVLKDGTHVDIRLVRPDDKTLLRDGFAKLSAESRYARFLGSKTSLTDDELRYLTELDQETHFALGAISNGVGAGIARFIRLPELHATAEAAIAVADELQGRGLGRLLFLRLCAAAAERGVERFRCELLGSNTGMRALLEQLAPERTIESAGGVTTFDLLLPNVTPTAPPDPPPDGGMYRLLRAAAENAVEWTDAVRRAWRR